MKLLGSPVNRPTSPAMQFAYKNLIAILAIATAAIIGAELISRTVAFHDLQLWAYDFVVTHSPEPRPSDKVVVVDFDDATLARERQFPIPRDVVASAVSRVAEAGAKVIGLDFLLTEARSEPQDAAMEKALAQAGNVVLACRQVPEAFPLSCRCAASVFPTQRTSGTVHRLPSALPL